MAGMFFGGRQSNGNRRVAVGRGLTDLIALARFLSEDSVIHTLRFLISAFSQFHVALQVGTALPEIQLCSLSLHCSLLWVFWFCPLCNAERCIKSKCPS